MKNYILVTQTIRTPEKKNPWKLIFKGRRLEALEQYNDDDMFEYATGKQALLVALRMQTFTPVKTMVIVDPTLKQEQDIEENDMVRVSEQELVAA